jgi:hypothetical protein
MRMFRIAMVMVALVLGACLARPAGAQASPSVGVLETWPGGDNVSLANGSNFYLRIGYASERPVSIWARPYFAGKEVVAGSNPSRSYSGSGEALGWFFLMHPGDQVDEVRILVGDGSPNGTTMLASRRVRITAGSAGSAGAAAEPPEWVVRMKQQDAAAQQADFEKRQSTPPTAGDAVLFGGFMLAMLAVGVLGFLAPAWALWRWRGGWRLAAAVPAAMMGFVVLRVMVDTAADPTSHNLWPFEVLQVGVVSLVLLGIVSLVRWRALREA